MKNCTALLSALLLTVALSSTSFALDKSQTFTGQVSDAMCGAHHMEPGANPADCTRACVSKGSKFALVVGDKVYTLDGENKASLDQLNALAGKNAKVTGMLNNDTIQVSAVSAAK